MSKNNLLTHIINEDKDSYRNESLSFLEAFSIGDLLSGENLIDKAAGAAKQKFVSTVDKALNNAANWTLNLFTKEGRLQNKMRSIRAYYIKEKSDAERQKAKDMKRLLGNDRENLEDIEKDPTIEGHNKRIQNAEMHIAFAEAYIKARRNLIGNEAEDDNFNMPSSATLQKEDDDTSKLYKEVIRLSQIVNLGDPNKSATVAQAGVQLNKTAAALARKLGIPLSELNKFGIAANQKSKGATPTNQTSKAPAGGSVGKP